MKNKMIRLLICILFILLPTSISYGLNGEYLDVRLTKPLVQKTSINLESNSGFLLLDGNNKDNIIFNIDETNIKAILDGKGIHLVDGQSNILYTLPIDGSILISPNDLYDPIITVEKDMYRDYIKLVGKNSEIYVINHIHIEKYLYGVVPSEMPTSFSLEALKAQAVASRTFAFSNSKHISEGFHLCDTTHCQVYSGFIYERPATNLAVDETKGKMAYYDGKLIEAIYHSTSSGYTEDSANVWGGDLPYLKSIEDTFSIDSPYSNWSFGISQGELNSKLMDSGIDVGEIQKIETIDTTSTGMVNKIKLLGSKGEKVISGAEFRNILGATKFRSTTFIIKNSSGNTNPQMAYVMDGKSSGPKNVNIGNLYILDGKDKKTVNRSAVNRAMDKDRMESIGTLYPATPSSDILIEGKGYGHGVGMSQFGANKMGELGYGFEEILKYYYTGIEVY